MRAPLLFALPLFAFPLFTAACGSPTTNPPIASNPPAPVADGGAPAETADADAGAPPAETETCRAQGEKLQAALDKARKSPHALLAVKSPECGTKVYISGDPKTAQADSLFRIGSVTKTYVSAVVLTLVRDGKLTLEDTLDKWIPGLPKTTGVTVRMLMNHTSGIFNYTEDDTFFPQPKREWKPREIVDLALTHDAYFAPGAGFHYSNTNYTLLGMLAEQAGGAKLGELVRKRALEPAHLSATFFDGEEPLKGELAPGFDAAGKDATYAIHPSGPWAAGAMVASGADVAEWVSALYAGPVLDEAGKKLLVADPVTEGGSAYGLGVVLLPASASGGAGPSLGHTGGIPGFSTMAFYFPEKRTALVGIVNKDGANANDILAAALGVLLQ